MIKTERFLNNLEITGAIIMSVAALLTTWCGFQNSRWGGINNTQLADANLKISNAMEKTLALNQQYMADGMQVLNFACAYIEGKQHLVDFYLTRVRPDLANVMTLWLQSKPLENAGAFPQPMAMPQYVDSVKMQYAIPERLRKEAETCRAEASQAGDISDKYLSLTLLYSVIMFLGGIESKFDILKVRFMFLSLSVLLFLFATYRMLLLPVT